MSAHWEEMVRCHTVAIETLDAKIEQLKLRRAQRQRLLEEARLRAKSLKPCKMCNRWVPKPCNDSEGFHLEGPWDTFCRDYFMGNATDEEVGRKLRLGELPFQQHPQGSQKSGIAELFEDILPDDPEARTDWEK